MLLRHQHVVILTIPAPCPVFVGPAQAERKRRPAALQHRLDRPLQQTLAGKPVVVIAEPTDAITPRQRGLLLHHLRRAQVLVTQIGRHPLLLLAAVIAARLRDLGPLLYALPPPPTFLRSRHFVISSCR